MRKCVCLLLLLGGASGLDLRMCDMPAGNSWGEAFVKRMYAMQPPTQNPPYDDADACRRYFAGDDMLMFWTDSIKAQCVAVCGTAMSAATFGAATLCGAATFGIATPACVASAIAGVLASTLCYNPWVVQDAGGCKAKLIQDYDVRHGYNFVFAPWREAAWGVWSQTKTWQVPPWLLFTHPLAPL
jgi:hypothetical protein